MSTSKTSQWAIPLGSVLAALIGLYPAFIILGSFPFFQRHFLYAHKVINSPLLKDTNHPEHWGFARNQVTPFHLSTVDGESLYAWHILPLQSYLKHEESIQNQATGFCKDFTKTESFRILREDPEARLVVHFHGNAGHIAQGIRHNAYHTLTDTSNLHLLALDYRGFGKSTGKPTEAGLILDGTTAVDWVMNVAGIPPSRIVLLGQSLGTAVTTGVAEHFADQGIEFAGIVLVAGFSNIPTLLSSYRIAGWVPVLAPLKMFPPLVRMFQRFIVDKWQTSDRLANIVKLTRTRLRLSILHAKNDWDIPCHESDRNFASVANATMETQLDPEAFQEWRKERTKDRDDGTFVTIVNSEPNIVIRHEMLPYGGHNDIMMSSPVTLAILRSFGFQEK